MSSQWASTSYIPLRLRQWANTVGTHLHDHDSANISPDHSCLALLSTSKSLISVYELKEGLRTFLWFGLTPCRHSTIHTSSIAVEAQCIKKLRVAFYTLLPLFADNKWRLSERVCDDENRVFVVVLETVTRYCSNNTEPNGANCERFGCMSSLVLALIIWSW